jgi:hypothetical protein
MISTEVPTPGWDESLNSPPSNSVRSRMPISPKLPWERGWPGSNPRPKLAEVEEAIRRRHEKDR